MRSHAFLFENGKKPYSLEDACVTDAIEFKLDSWKLILSFQLLNHGFNSDKATTFII